MEEEKERADLLREAARETANSILVLKNRQEEQLRQTQAELRQALEEVRRAEAEFSSAFEFAPIGMALVDPQGAFLRVNKSYCQLLGYAPGELLQRTFRDITHPDDLALSLHHREQLMAGVVDSYRLEKRYLTRDGATVWVSLSVSLVTHPDGSPKHTVAQILDVTESRAAAEALRRSEQEATELARHYKSILDSQSVYIVKTDARGNYTYVNDYYRRECAYPGELLGTSAVDNIVEEDRPKCAAVVEKCYRTPEVWHEVILRKRMGDGRIMGGKWEFKAILGHDGQVSELLCVGFDITEQLQALDRTRQLLEVSSAQNVRLKSFAQIVSHNLRSHSANFAGLLSLLDGAAEDEKAGYLDMLRGGAEQLEQTIRNLNEIVTVNEHADRPRERRFLREEVNKTLRILHGLVVRHRIRVRVTIPEDASVEVVPAYLDSILLNLISNAIKYRSPDREATVDISGGPENGYTLLAVRDNGLGIDLARHGKKLFGLYKTFHRNADARGFGLYLTKSQVEAMGGRIEAESEVGAGSTFKVYFHENAPNRIDR
jgi:PAS domain S-box-containing protein